MAFSQARPVLGVLLIHCAVFLAGCGGLREDKVERLDAVAINDRSQQSAQEPFSEQGSILLHELAGREEVLMPGTAFAEVARGVLAQESFAAEAMLVAARQEQLAVQKNWMPQVTPTLGLGGVGLSLGLSVSKSLFDGRGRRATIDMAESKVDTAAVRLAQDVNETVGDVLKKYVSLSRARKDVESLRRAEREVVEVEKIVAARAKAGIDGPSELASIRMIHAELREELALAELQLTRLQREVLQASGLDGAETDLEVPELSVTLQRCNTKPSLERMGAHAQYLHELASLNAERLGMLPQVQASAGVSTAGGIGPSIGLGNWAFQFGRKHRIAALEQKGKAVQEAYENALREELKAKQALKWDVETAGSALRASRAMLANAKEDHVLTKRQFKSGTRRADDLARATVFVSRAQREVSNAQSDLVLSFLATCQHAGQLVSGRDIFRQLDLGSEQP